MVGGGRWEVVRAKCKGTVGGGDHSVCIAARNCGREERAFNAREGRR